jgi:putative transposase
VNRRVLSQAVVTATGVTADGHREVLGFDVGNSEGGAFWTAFLRSLTARQLGGGQLVTSDAHTGLKAAISAVLMVAAAIRTIFAKPDAGHVREHFDVIAVMLGNTVAKVEQMPRDAKEDLLAFTGFPVAHWKKIWSTNPLERHDKEVAKPELMTACQPIDPHGVETLHHH